MGPLHFADTALIEVSLDKITRRSLSLRYDIYRVEDPQSVLVARARVVCAVTDLEAFRAVEVPEDLRALFLELSQPAG
jgi:acyl-CoA thioesterase FadM